MKAAIAIDAWKLEIFNARLRAAGYSFTQCPGLSPGTLMLAVETDNTIALQRVVESANRECAISRRPAP